jgi:hypothetical protein
MIGENIYGYDGGYLYKMEEVNYSVPFYYTYPQHGIEYFIPLAIVLIYIWNGEDVFSSSLHKKKIKSESI